MVVDFHAHAITKEYLDGLNSLGIDPLKVDGFKVPDWSAKDHLAFMKEAGIDFSILSTPTPHLYNGDSEQSAKVNRQVNKSLSEICKSYPNKFAFVASLPLPEDVGLSAPNALLQACASLYALDHLGMPEGNLALTQAIIYVCESPKDNRVVIAKEMAEDDARNHADDRVPDYLKNHTEASKNYKYPHDYGGWVEQQYLPDSLKDRCYFKRKNKDDKK